MTPASAAPARVVAAIDRTVAGLAAAALLAMMVLTVIDVVGRYGFDSPVPGAFELTELLMAVLIFGALPIVSAQGRHIAITLIEDRLPARVRIGLGRIVDAIATLVLALMAWRLAVLAGDFQAYGEVTSYLRIGLAPFAWFAALGCLLAAISAAVGATGRDR
ncbi:MAG: C4-dicarboxylate ABC transporter permease [Rhodospirillaceae bacterium]|nr:C4-dicarboxylate ABC transporter permease [Rhodospirillaceae bacterium]